MHYLPLDDHLLIAPIDSATVTPGGVHLPDSSRERPIHGKVLRVGEGKRDKEGNRLPLTIKSGDLVVYDRFGGREITVEGQKCIAIRESEVICYLRPTLPAAGK